MPLYRRSLLVSVPALALAPALFAPARAADAVLTERAIGSATAPVSVIEFFSLTCPHCARFARDSLPDIQAKLIDPGKLRYLFHDYPLDQVALMAAQVARALPPDRYAPFTLALLASQDRWAFARGVDSRAELAKMAALAGPRPRAPPPSPPPPRATRAGRPPTPTPRPTASTRRPASFSTAPTRITASNRAR